MLNLFLNDGVLSISFPRYFENTPAVLRCMVEKDYEMFDLCHVEHKEYILNGSVVIGHATNVDENQGVVYVGQKGSMGAQGNIQHNIQHD
jgi:hypothetical protein